MTTPAPDTEVSQTHVQPLGPPFSSTLCIPAHPAHDPYAAAYGWGGGGHDHYGLHASAMAGGYGQMPREHHHRDPNPTSDVQTQPLLMTLKQFLATQDDAISDSDAIEKYNEYKLDFKRQQMNEFFVAHKDEEW